MAQPNSAQPPLPPPSPLLPPSIPRRKKERTDNSIHPVHKTLATAANLANLLPTGTVLSFRTLTPSFSNKGICQLSNKCLTAFLMALCAIVCFLSSFTDSFVDEGKLYYGIATFKGMHIFNDDNNCSHDQESDGENSRDNTIDLTKFKISFVDFVHAFVSLFVFLIFALSDSDVQNCFFPHAGENMNVLVMNLPLGAGVFSSFLFLILPTTRRGIGCAEMPRSFK
ncbi:protein DMP10-like [Olea europaea var. sylvestris]|uniref:Protein DMP10-like n=1 Tax=Olea europaea subsp. europaea TaxID=158383 RepID=A0A8S0RDT6_OLEEU|nr:protein DMP10-like [Olea europaea var. sylvestris]CAA2976444.1 protein DMP10-like [Olea europaea subsp. europaea]